MLETNLFITSYHSPKANCYYKFISKQSGRVLNELHAHHQKEFDVNEESDRHTATFYPNDGTYASHKQFKLVEQN